MCKYIFTFLLFALLLNSSIAQKSDETYSVDLYYGINQYKILNDDLEQQYCHLFGASFNPVVYKRLSISFVAGIRNLSFKEEVYPDAGPSDTRYFVEQYYYIDFYTRANFHIIKNNFHQLSLESGIGMSFAFEEGGYAIKGNGDKTQDLTFTYLSEGTRHPFTLSATYAVRFFKRMFVFVQPTYIKDLNPDYSGNLEFVSPEYYSLRFGIRWTGTRPVF